MTEQTTTVPVGAADIGVTGLAVMGANLARNFARHGYTVALHNRSRARTDALVAEHGDVWFINGQPLDDVAGLIADVASRSRAGAPLRFGLSAFVVARETQAEAQAAYERLLALSKKDAPIKAIQKQNTEDRKSVV